MPQTVVGTQPIESQWKQARWVLGWLITRQHVSITICSGWARVGPSIIADNVPPRIQSRIDTSAKKNCLAWPLWHCTEEKGQGLWGRVVTYSSRTYDVLVLLCFPVLQMHSKNISLSSFSCPKVQWHMLFAKSLQQAGLSLSDSKGDIN